MNKRLVYVVPMDDMLQDVRPAALEEVMRLYPRHVLEPEFLPVFLKGERVTLGIFSERWRRAVMADVQIAQAVHEIEFQLFARYLRDILLVHITNFVPDDSFYHLKNKLDLQNIDSEKLFSESFCKYFRMRDLPESISLGYNGSSLFIR